MIGRISAQQTQIGQMFVGKTFRPLTAVMFDKSTIRLYRVKYCEESQQIRHIPNQLLK